MKTKFLKIAPFLLIAVVALVTMSMGADAYIAGGMSLATVPLLFVEKTQVEFEAMSYEDQLKHADARVEFKIAQKIAEKDAKIEELKTLHATDKATQDSVIKEYSDKQGLIIEELKAIKATYKSLKDNSGASMETKELKPLAKFMKEQSEITEKSKTTGMSEVEIKSTELISPFVNKVAAEMTTANVIPNVAGGFSQLFGNYIDPNIYSAPKVDPFILQEVTVSFQAGTEDIWWTERQNEEGDAAFIGEGDAKPLIDAEWKDFKTSVKEIAEFWKITERLKNNAPRAVANFQEHANELMSLGIHDGVLNGDNTGDELNGIINQASAFVVPAELANFYPSANIWDVIMAAAMQVRLQNHKGQITAVLNTVWEAKMAGYKNADGDYIVPPFVSKDGKTVGSVKVRFETDFADDAILIGVLKNFNVVFSTRATYSEGLESDDFRKNKISRRIAAWLGAYIPSTQVSSIVYDDIATIELAIEYVPT